MTPAQARNALDRHLGRYGQRCELRRVISGVTRSVALRASIRDYSPAELSAAMGYKPATLMSFIDDRN
ncbi:MAG: hypothetical protein U1E25_14575 [Methylocystis sp.]